MSMVDLDKVKEDAKGCPLASQLQILALVAIAERLGNVSEK